ncbi:unnamed protein product [Tilletia controversa]|nr:unnamed protein product [Tilletia controversa]
MLTLSTSSSSLAAILDRTGILLPLAGLSLLVLVFIYHDRALGTRSRRAGVYFPPKTLPLLGHTIWMLKKGMDREQHQIFELTKASKNGCAQLSVLGAGTFFFLSRPEYIEGIQKTYFENFEKGDFFQSRFGDVLGHNGIFVSDGHTWKTARKTASHIFSAAQFRNWVQVVVHQELDSVVSLLNNLTLRGNEAVITLPELFFRYTLNSFSRMAFSSDIGCLTKDPACLDTPVEFALAFDYAQQVINSRSFDPIFKQTELFSAQGKNMRKAVASIQTFAGGIIDDRLRAVQREKKANQDQGQATRATGTIAQLAKKDGKDLLDLFMETTQDREELLIVVLNFLIAGRDTTAQLLSWFFYEMMAHPEHLDGIRRELTEVLGECPEEGYRLPYDRLRDVPYTFACITEALRLHPSVPKNGKRCVKDTLIVPSKPNPTNLPPIQIYKGEMAGWSDWVMARLPEVWGADCEEYRPSRFLDSATEDEEGRMGTKQYSQWQQHMFNGGPRLCLEMNLANFEALSIVAAIVPLFDVHWARADQGQTASWPPKYLASVTLPSEPYQVEFRRRAR